MVVFLFGVCCVCVCVLGVTCVCFMFVYANYVFVHEEGCVPPPNIHTPPPNMYTPPPTQYLISSNCVLHRPTPSKYSPGVTVPIFASCTSNLHNMLCSLSFGVSSSFSTPVSMRVAPYPSCMSSLARVRASLTSWVVRNSAYMFLTQARRSSSLRLPADLCGMGGGCGCGAVGGGCGG